MEINLIYKKSEENKNNEIFNEIFQNKNEVYIFFSLSDELENVSEKLEKIIPEGKASISLVSKITLKTFFDLLEINKETNLFELAFDIKDNHTVIIDEDTLTDEYKQNFPTGLKDFYFNRLKPDATKYKINKIIIISTNEDYITDNRFSKIITV